MNIVIVEDELHTLNELKDYVIEFDPLWHVHAFNKPKEAMEWIETHGVDAALLDIEMPEVNGFELAERIHRKYPSCFCAFVSGYNNYASQAFDVDAIDYVLKPIRKERLFKTLEKIKIKVNKRKAEPEHAHVSISLFNEFKVYKNNNLIKFKRKKSAELLAYLLLHHNVSISKDRIIDDLFDHQSADKALVSLQSAVYQLRKDLSFVNRDQLTINYNNNAYQLYVKDIEVDVFNFDQCFNEINDDNVVEVHRLETIKELYGKGLLTYEGWVWSFPYQSEYEEKFIRVIKVLIQHYIQAKNTKALEIELFRLREYLDEHSLEFEKFKDMVFTYFNEEKVEQWVNAQ